MNAPKESFTLEVAPATVAKANWGALIPMTIALSSALFTAMGFLATRSYIGSLGLPDHVNIPVDGYLQHGARFFVLAVHMLPMGLCAGLLLLVGGGFARWWRPLGKLSKSPAFICLVLGGAALLTVGLELSLLDPEPVFAPGRVRYIQGEMRWRLYLIEFAIAITLAWLGARFSRVGMGSRSTLALNVLRALALLSLFVEILLFPLCFGRVAMIPDSFQRLSLRRDNEPANLDGVLVYSDADDFFVYTDQRLQLAGRSHSDGAEAREFGVSISSASLGEVGRDRGTASSWKSFIGI